MKNDRITAAVRDKNRTVALGGDNDGRLNRVEVNNGREWHFCGRGLGSEYESRPGSVLFDNGGVARITDKSLCYCGRCEYGEKCQG